MTIIELMDTFTSFFEHQPRAYNTGVLAAVVRPSSPEAISGFRVLGRVLAGAITLGSVVMNIGRQIVELGFRVSMYGFGLWVVSSAIKQLSGPISKMAAIDALDRAPSVAA